jgi:antitoxin (DNA-binding transcriptional repressor) of toxin-antitoxin stability system
MSIKTVDLKEAQAQLPELLTLALEGNEVIIAEGDKPLARLVPFAPSARKRVAGLHRGMAWTSDDFDEPLPDEFWIGDAK